MTGSGNGVPIGPFLPGVALVGPSGPEVDAAWRWLEGVREVPTARRLLPEELASAFESPLVWVHSAGPLPDLDAARLAAFAAGGGGVLLTLRAAGLVPRMGIEPLAPNEDTVTSWRGDADSLRAGARGEEAGPRERGLAAFGPHPLFDGLHNGTASWAPTDGERWSRCCYVRGARPVEGRVVAVERGFNGLNQGRIVAWEYAVGRGRVLCIGTFIQFSATDQTFAPQLSRLVLNALRSLSASGADRRYWPEPATSAAPSEALALPEPLDLEGALPEPSEDPIALAAPAASDEPWDLAGRRVLMVGRERQGLGEVWIHPHRAVASWDVLVDGDPASALSVVVSPDMVQRTLDTPRRRIVETHFAALEHPALLVEYRGVRKGRASVGQEPPSAAVTLTMDLRRAWPFAAGCGGNLAFRQDARGLVAAITTESDEGKVVLFTNRPTSVTLKAVRTAGGPMVVCTIVAPLDVPLRIAVVGGANREELERSLRAVRRLGIAGLVRQRLQRGSTQRDARLSLHTPETRLPVALEWAKRRLDAFLADVPGVGRSLLAGYASPRDGGDERPPRACFLGRDACWSSFALLASGEHSLPRQVIRFLGDTQDLRGKVAHTATTSGQFHYDAADSTPLYLLLVARYLAWTGDRDFVRSIWSRVERALAYCISADDDGDGLMENSRAGHAWLESGPLAGAHVTLYLATVWRAALEGVARAAEALDKPRIAADCFARAARAADAITGSFRDERRALLALDVRAGGRRTWTQTALHANALVLGASEPKKMKRLLDALASDAFSAPWGVRLLSVDDPKYDPAAAHGGAVWPLFTGWAALAEYRAGRPEAGLRHLLANASLGFARQLGAFDEALHGIEERGIGACSDHACAAAMVVLPVVEGLLGVEPDAPGGKLTLAPALPAAWPSMELRGVRCGESAFDVRVRRRPHVLEVRLRRTLGPSLWVTVAPWLGAAASKVEIDGQVVKANVVTAGDGVRSSVTFQAGAENDLRFELA